RVWIAWWAPWAILVGAAGLAGAALAIAGEHRRASGGVLRALVLVPLAYAIAGVAAAALLAGPHAVAEISRGPQRFTGAARLAGLTGLWPNVYSTVGELARPSLADPVQSFGGWLPLALAALGLVTAITDRGRPAR